MSLPACGTLSLLLALQIASAAYSADANVAGPANGGASWEADYGRAMDQAAGQGKMMLIFFHAVGENPLRDRFESDVLTDPAVRGLLPNYVCVRVPVDAQIRRKGKETAILKHEAYREMGGRQGIAVLDFAHRDASYYGCVVSAYPFTDDRCYSARQLAIILDLRPGGPRERHDQYVARLRALKPSAAAGDLPDADLRQEVPSAEIAWLGDYRQAAEAAEAQGKMLFIFFCDAPSGAACRRFESESLADPAVRKRLQECVCLRLPLDAKVTENGNAVVLLTHAAFSEMSGGPGIAIIDYAHNDSKYYGYVVSAFPITGRLGYTPQQTAAMLDLPAGTITQRTLIWAVRTHPEHPASTQGEFAPVLAEEAEGHSQYQANIRLQGHHGWGSRFARILGRLPRGLTASEVCAESWPGENLVEAAVDCVQCWRSSSGHWSAVRARHPMYGYDMKRGRNGIWYATGIFGRG